MSTSKAPLQNSDGLLFIDKPQDCTSFDVVRKVRKALGVRKVGHGGTLDPLATGLLVVLIGKASKLQPLIMDGTKRYQGIIQIGAATDTDDVTGAVVARAEQEFDLTQAPWLSRVEEAATAFCGDIEQVPPSYSSIKVDGKRSYALAREGQSVELKSRPVHIYELELSAVASNELAYNVVCSKGTYVRSLARDIGARLGLHGCIKSIRRLSTGRVDVEHAIGLEELCAAEQPWEHVLSIGEFAADLPAFQITEAQHAALASGDQRPLGQVALGADSGGLLRIVDNKGRFLGLARRSGAQSWRLWFLI